MTKKIKADRRGYLFDNRALTALIIPLVVEQLLAILVGMADSIMIASVGEAAVSGVSLVDQIMVLIIQMFGALATGGAVVAGQYLGQKNEGQACKSATQLIWFIALVSLVITVFLYIGKHVILQGVFGSIEADVMRHADTYLMIVTASIPFIALYNGGAAVFRAMGNSRISMKISVLMNVVNVAGNAALIYGFHFGTAGVAIPTLVSRVLAAFIVIWKLCDQKQVLHVKKSLRFRPEWTLIRKILSIGVPNGLESSMFQLGKIMVLSLVSTFGTYAIAANAVSNILALFAILPGIAISLAATTVISRCVGAGDYEQVKYYNKKLIFISGVSMMVMVALLFALLPFIMRVYNLSEQTAEVTRQICYFHGIAAIIIWPLSFNLPSTFRAAGDATACMVISSISMWVFRIGASYLLGQYFGMGVFGVWVAMVIDWLFRTICFVIRYFGGSWKKKALV